MKQLLRRIPGFARFIEWFSRTWLGLKIWPLYLVVDSDKTFRITRMKGTDVTCKQFLDSSATKARVQIKSEHELDPYRFEDSWPVPPRMWVKLSGTEIGIPLDTDPNLSYRENVRLCLLGAEKELKTRGVLDTCCKLLGTERVIGEITGSEGAWPIP